MPEVPNNTRLSWRHIDLAALLAIIVLGGLLYGHTLHVPWYMDDIRGIVENPTIHNLPAAIDNVFFSSSRGIANLTFALNYAIGGTDVTGYHLVNILIHLVTSWLVFLLMKRVFRDRPLLALGGALIFVAHPLQTQAVTYIIQRMTSLAALLFFLALYLYVLAREQQQGEKRRVRLFYGGALLSGVLAVLVKQNTAVLPVALFLFDRYFLASEQPRTWRRQLLAVAPFAVGPVILAAITLLLPMLSGGEVDQVGGMPDLMHLRHQSPLNYLFTEFSVIWLYLRLLFLPYGQALDYDVPIVATIWTWQSWLALAGILVLLAVATWLRKRQPIVSAGIFWFFLCLSVESTLIPLDPVFEHRLYLPMFGFALVIMAGLARLSRRISWGAGVLLVGILAVLTWQRNQLWTDPVAFFEHNLQWAPRNERVHLDLGNAYRRQGRLEEARDLYLRALEINPDYTLVHVNLSLVYAAQGAFDKAVATLQDGLQRQPNRVKLYQNLGVLYNRLGRFREAAEILQRGLQRAPTDANLHFNLGLALDRLGRLDEAITHFHEATSLKPDFTDSYFNLGMARYKKGQRRQALEAFLTAYRLNPRDAKSLFNAAMLSFELGKTSAARDLAARLQQLDPAKAQILAERLRRQSKGP